MLISKTVIMKWHSSNKQWYESKGYIFTKFRDEFEVKTEDLQDGSNIKVKVQCDNCNKIYFVHWYYYNKQFLKFKKTSCKFCAYKLYGINNITQTRLKNGMSFEQWCINNNKEDILNRWDYELNDYKPSEINYGTKNKYYFKCPLSLHNSELRNISGFTSGINKHMGCNACNSFFQYLINLYGKDGVKNYWSDKNTISPLKISYCSGEKIWIKCPICGNEKFISPAKFINEGLACPKCSDGISYPEKFMFSILEQLDIDFQTQLSKKDFKWCKGENYDIRYDFYLVDYNCIVETHGSQHYKDKSEKSIFNSLREEQINDTFKENLAKQNGIINYISIDCRKSELEFIKNNILNSQLSNLFDISKIDWTECEKYINISLVKTACDLWNSRTEKVNKIINISNEMKLCKNTITKYLKRGAINGWCNYNAYEESKKVLKTDFCKKVYCVELNRVYNSFKEISYDLKINAGSISKVCNGKLNTAGKLHYHFQYYLENK